MPNVIYENHILRRLDPEAITRLDLKPLNLLAESEIESPGKQTDGLIFIEQGVASITTTLNDGFRVDVAVAGKESVLGLFSLLGTGLGHHRICMQIGGHGFKANSDIASREFKRGELFQDLTIRYLHSQSIQLAQTSGCNAHHTAEQRLAKGLLLCADRNGNRVLPLKHQFIADMIGASRPTVTIISGQLQARNLIQATRGQLQLLDLKGLEATACECYEVVRDHFKTFSDSTMRR